MASQFFTLQYVKISIKTPFFCYRYKTKENKYFHYIRLINHSLQRHRSSIINAWQDFEFPSVAGSNLKSSISDVLVLPLQPLMIFAKRFIQMFDKVLNTLLQFILRNALDVYQLKVLAICLRKLLIIFHHISTSIVHSQIHVPLCSHVSIDGVFFFLVPQPLAPRPAKFYRYSFKKWAGMTGMQYLNSPQKCSYLQKYKIHYKNSHLQT